MWLLLGTVVLLAQAEKYGQFQGNFVRKEPQRSNKLRRMINRRLRKHPVAIEDPEKEVNLKRMSNDLLLTPFQTEKISEITQTSPSSWRTDYSAFGRMDLRGAATISPRWNRTNSNGQTIVPFRFHENFPKKVEEPRY